MISKEDRKAALYELSFNRWKALRLFSFCFASFFVGLTALYWTLDYKYEQRLEEAKSYLLTQMDILEAHYQVRPVSDLYNSVVAFEGKADFDDIKVISIESDVTNPVDEDLYLEPIHGQKRVLAPGVYEIRFGTAKELQLTPSPSPSQGQAAATAAQS